MNDYIDTTMRSIQSVQAAQNSVSSRVIQSPAIPVFDFFYVLMDIRKVKRYWSAMVGADEVASQGFENAKQEIDKVSSVTQDFREGLGKNGGNLGALDINKLQSDLFNDDELMNNLMNRLHGEEELSDSERRILYYYIQNQFFDTDKRADMKSIARWLETDPSHLKNHLTNDVLKTEASLYEEILMTEMYLYMGNQYPKDGHLSGKEQALLTAYLETLYNYRSSLVEMKGVDAWLADLDPNEPLLAEVDKFEFNDPGDPQAFYIDTIITISKFPADEQYGREDFLNRDRSLLGGSISFQSQISHYYSGDDLQRKDNLDARKEFTNYTNDFIGGELLSLSLEILTKGHPVASIVETVGDYAEGRSEQVSRMTEGDAKLAANDFGLEIQITERVSMEPGYDPYEINFIATDETYAIMNRWKEVVEAGSNIPYPNEGIAEDNWFLISDYFHRNQSEMKESYPEEYEYIFGK